MVKLLLGGIVLPYARVFVSIFLISLYSLEIRSAARQFASGVDLVEVYATVSDARGEPVAGLTKDDFIVEEDGRRQEIRTFSAGEFPLALAVGIDRSFSMARVGFPGVTRAVRGFLNALRREDQAMLVGIGSETEVLAPLSRDRSAALSALDRLDAWGTTPLYDATLSAVDAIEAASGRRALILISDGTDRYSQTKSADLLDRIRRKDVLIYPVALGRTRDAVFVEMATVTGGRSFQVANVSALPGALSSIAGELRFQYLIGYGPPGGGRPGWRSIQVRVNRPDVRVRSREGYVAP
jgi:Ca-activated chloride channel family protein